jgi:site-specific DNA-methyltransferase (adenine-specific)
VTKHWTGKGWEIHHCDALRWIEQYEGEPFAAVIADTPYSSGGATRGDRMSRTTTKYINSDSGNRDILPDFEGDNRDQRSFIFWCALWLQAARMKCKPGAVLFTFCDWRQLPAMTDAVQAGGWVWRAIVPWNKTEATRPQMGRPRAQCEYVVFGTNGPHEAFDGAPCMQGFFECPTPKDRIHITEKPIELYREIAQLVPPDGLVLDPFLGSAASGVGVLVERRRFVGLEIVPEIAELAVTRLKALDDGISLEAAQGGQLPLLPLAKVPA